MGESMGKISAESKSANDFSAKKQGSAGISTVCDSIVPVYVFDTA
jgi:hypothetical protein